MNLADPDRDAGPDPAGWTQSELVAALQRHEATAFEWLVRHYSGRLLATARRLLRDEADCADAVQEAFLSAYRSIDGFEGNATLTTWLHRIVVNCCLMLLRKQRRRNETSIDDLLPQFDRTGHRIDPGRGWRSTPDEELLKSETRALVRRLIDQLPDDYRIVLLLRDIEELDTEETARLLQVTVGTVKTRLHRARQALQTLLTPHFTQ